MNVGPVSFAGRRVPPDAPVRPPSRPRSTAAFLQRLQGERITIPLRDVTWGDAAVAAAVLVGLLVLPGAIRGDRLDLFGAALAPVIAAAILVRRVRPAEVLLVTLGLGVVWVTSDHGEVALAIALMVALYTVGDQCPPVVSIPATVLTVAVVYVTAGVSSNLRAFDHNSLGDLGWLVAAAVVGGVVRSRRVELAGVLAREADRREHEAEQRVTGERLRIARELHDAVGHTVATVTMQAGVAARLVDTEPAKARAAMEDVAAIGRGALRDIRSTLGMLRSGDGPGVAATGPVRSLADIDGLFDLVRARGITVHVERRGDVDGVAAGLGGTLYRIAQESATNVVRHGADATEVHVTLDAGPGEVVLAVRNDGALLAGPVEEPPGHHGLEGMRERATAVGGILLAGPLPEGGFEVRAVVPVSGEG